MGKRVRLFGRSEAFAKFGFRIEEAQLEYERFDGSMSAKITRLVLDRGDSISVLLQDPAARKLVLAEQFRYPTYEKGPGWLLELPAGLLDEGETPEQGARRETFEETGYRVDDLRHIATVYLSPGGSSERNHVFEADIALDVRAGEGAGIEAEGEDIRLVVLSFDEAFAKVRNGEILDAKTLIGLQWLMMSD